MQPLTLYAGERAYAHIRSSGLAAQDIAAVFGASGAAKWLTIYGLDKAVFSQWLPDSGQPIDLFGTSVGAFKLAAAAQSDPAAALSVLAQAYIDQRYAGKITAEQVNRETRKILDAFLTPQSIEQILVNPRYHYHCGSVRCRGLLASENATAQKLAMVKALLLSLAGRSKLNRTFERAIFFTANSTTGSLGEGSCNDGFTTHHVQLTARNFSAAVLSSGSIPVIMPGIADIEGAPVGVYRDGGLIDYHAVPDNVGRFDQGLVLYPHFYTYLKEGWFDKFMPWRRVPAARLQNTIIIGPSEQYVRSLPGGEIPDRQDFIRFKDNDEERIRRWSIARDMSESLGEAFLALVRSGEIANVVEPIPH